MSEKTTIKVGKDVVSRLIKLKIHSRQSNEEVILKLLESYNKNDE
jgi:predicted CopG family antitoxin